MANLRANNLTGTGGRNAIDGSVFFSRGTSTAAVDYLGFSGISVGTSDFTIEGWLYKTKTENYPVIVDTRESGNADAAGFFFGTDSSGYLYYYTQATNAIKNTIISNHCWNHFALVRASNTTTLYINGVSSGTYSDANNYTRNITRLGSSQNTTIANNWDWPGYLSNVRITIGTAVYTTAFTPPTEKLEALTNTKLLCCQDSDDPTQEATGKTITGYGNYYGNTTTNLITNSDFGTGDLTGWTTVQATTSVVSGSARIVPNSAVNGALYQQFTTVAGKQYKATMRVTNTPASNFARLHLGTGTDIDSANKYLYSSGDVQNLGQGTYSLIFTSAGTTTTLWLEVGGGQQTSTDFDDISVVGYNVGTAPKVIPPVGVDEGVVFDGDIKMNSQDYMYFPTGDTSQRGRGTALYGGGYKTPNSITAIDYLSIQSGGLTEEWGNLSTTQLASGAACSSSSRWVTAGGWTGANNNAIEYVTFTTSGNSLEFGDLVVGRRNTSAVSNSTRGIWGGGYISPADAGTDSMDYITIASTGNATDFGNLSGAAKSGTATGSTTRAVFALGNVAPADVDTLEYVTIASTGNATDFGNLQASRYGRDTSGCSNGVRGLFAGGHYPTSVNTIDYITIASTGNASDFGDLFLARGQMGGTSNGTRGVFMGGTTNPARQTTIDSVIIATTGNAVNWGDFRTAKQGLNSAASDSHGGLS